MTRPYFQRGTTTIYCGDAYALLPELTAGGAFDLMLADCPYGINIVRGDGKMGDNSPTELWSNPNNPTYRPVHGDDKPAQMAALLPHAKRHIIWGGNYIADQVPATTCWLVWYKRINGQSNDFADCELAWTDLGGPARVLQHMWMGMLRDSEHGSHLHPTQKPVALMSWCLSLVPDATSIIDPFCGSGPVIEAAHLAGIPATGIDIDEQYCETTARRIEQGALQF